MYKIENNIYLPKPIQCGKQELMLAIAIVYMWMWGFLILLCHWEVTRATPWELCTEENEKRRIGVGMAWHIYAWPWVRIHLFFM